MCHECTMYVVGSAWGCVPCTCRRSWLAFGFSRHQCPYWCSSTRYDRQSLDWRVLWAPGLCVGHGRTCSYLSGHPTSIAATCKHQQFCHTGIAHVSYGWGTLYYIYIFVCVFSSCHVCSVRVYTNVYYFTRDASVCIHICLQVIMFWVAINCTCVSALTRRLDGLNHWHPIQQIMIGMYGCCAAQRKNCIGVQAIAD